MKRAIFFSILLSVNVFSQEIESNLLVNSVIDKNERYYSNKSFSNLIVPFIDDFSYKLNIPDTLLWENKSVFINRSYGYNPITIGVATFDGLNSLGRPYDISLTGTDSENADTLTSRIIDLSGLDTAYFMFFYQSQGLGNDPQVTDSLILEFSAEIDSFGNNVWNTIWKKPGSTVHDFKKFVYVFSDTNYLNDKFQFRFRNLASVTGNFDHWNIDYVKLDEYNNISDTSSLNDVSFFRETPKILRRYREMPWIHFVNDINLEMNDSLDIILRNNSQNIQSIDYRYDIFKNSNLVYHYPTLGGNNSTRNVDVPPFFSGGLYSFNSPPVMLDDQMFPVSSADSAEFVFRNSINTSPDDYKLNDTVYHIQRFYSHFAYDDGSPESAYGINVQGAKLAYEFKLNRPDTIRMIQFKFVEMHENLDGNKFLLTLWNNNNGIPGNKIYSDTVEVRYEDRGKFNNYYLKYGVGAVGTFFVGWEQLTDDILNLGLDKNSISNEYMYYNVGTGWINSQFSGSWMIRPVVNYDEPILNSTFENNSNIDVKIYPNPFNYKTTLHFNNQNSRLIHVLDMMGRKLVEIYSSDQEVSIYNYDFKKGIYFINILENDKRIVKKIIIN